MELYIFGGMMSAKTKKVVSLLNYVEVRDIVSLYKRFDACELGEHQQLECTSTGLSILDDVEFFLKHPFLRDKFERAFLMHLKEFSSNHL